MVIEIIAKIPPTDNPSIEDLEQSLNLTPRQLSLWTHHIDKINSANIYISSSSDINVKTYIYYLLLYLYSKIKLVQYLKHKT